MTERTIFLQALERERGQSRTEYLDEVCGQDADLRLRVEQLLQSHSDAGSFLGQPVVGSSVTSDVTPGGETETHSPDASTGEISLDFLAPSEKPDSLGRLDHYDVMEIVGRGGMGIVLRAFDEKLHRVVALKVMTRDVAGSAAARKRFSREAKAAAAVVHDHIVPIHAIEESGSTPYLVMQFIEGQSLQQKIDAEGSLELKEILRIGMQIASGLAAAHKQGLVHRDIKPSNILLENGVQRVKITDFGLARAVDDASVSQSGVVAGTPQYMSPEQAEGQPVDHRSDLFSLGSVMYAMCTGRPPFRAASTVATLKRVCDDTPRPIRELNPDMPEWLAAIIGKLHAKKPGERFQSAKEVAEELEQRLAGVQQARGVSVPESPVTVKPSRQLSPTVLLNLGIVSLLAGLVFIAVVANSAPDNLARWFFGLGSAMGLAIGSLCLYRFISRRRLSRNLQQIDAAQIGVMKPSRVRLIASWALVLVLVVALFTIEGRFVPWLKKLFYHEMVVRLGHPRIEIELWETTDTGDDPSRISFQGPLVPRAFVDGAPVERIWAPPGNYWLFARFNGRQIDRRLLKFGWGGRQEITIGDAEAAAKDHQLLQGKWTANSIKYINGPALGPEALPLTSVHFDYNRLRIKLPGYDSSSDYIVFVGTKKRELLLNSKGSTSTFRVDEVIEYALHDDTLLLILNCPQPRPSNNVYQSQGLPVPVPDNAGLEIVLRRKGSLRTKQLQDDTVLDTDLADLQRLVALKENAVAAAKLRVQAGVTTVGEVMAAEVNLLEARIKLAESFGPNIEDQVRWLSELVLKREEQWNAAKELLAAGRIPQSEAEQAEFRVAEAKLRLAKANRTSEEYLKGRWVAVSAEYQGRRIPDAEAKDMFPTELTIKRRQYGITWGGRQHEGTLTMIDVTKSPAEMDFSGSVFGDQKPRKVIYKLDGDTLTLCLPFVGPNADPPRPTEFKTDPQSKNAVLTYRRER